MAFRRFLHVGYIVPALIVVAFIGGFIWVVWQKDFVKAEEPPTTASARSKAAEFTHDKEAMRRYLAAQKKIHPELSDSIAAMEELLNRVDPEGLRLNGDGVKGLGLAPTPAKAATKQRALPPRVGTVNFDNDRLFIIRSRFGGEVAELGKLQDLDSGFVSSAHTRPWRYGDKIKQNELLAVIWSQPLGAAKAALVDAVCALRLSQDNQRRYEELYSKGAISLAAVKAGERQVQQDSGTLLTAERSLRMWKLTNEEIEEIKAEAKIIHDQKKVRSADDEMKWARVEIRVPKFLYDPFDPKKLDPHTELTIVEKNTNINDMLDPIASPPLYKLADLSRLQAWVQPPEEDLPLLRKNMNKGNLRWLIQFQALPNEAPLDLPVLNFAPSLDPNLRTPMVIGYLPNKENRYLVGQFVTATIFVAPEPDTVEIPTNALNEVEGESLVFVETDAAKHEYTLRRIAVAERFKDTSFVRSKLTHRDQEVSEAEQAKGRRPIQPLLPGERVVTLGVVELLAALTTEKAQELGK
jgi:multidrug efflux pump subunit AcrA (membrane-fusion protein)